jgi:signal recognition particle subunit SRP54
MAGLQGAGKTTTTGKLGKMLTERMKKKVLAVSTDVYRPAAIAQLQTVSQQAGIEFFPSTPDQKPVDIARAAVDYARRHYMDVLLVDTAGRLAIDQAMMEEIQALHAAVKPIETLFVVDAMLGQDAVNTARAFNERCPHRRRADQARWRCPRRCGTVGASRHRQAAQVCRCRREARRP